jgi:hypothetical protein
MLEGDSGIKDGYFDAFALGFFPEGWDAEEFKAPVDRLSCGQHDLVDLEGRESIDRRGHVRFDMRSESELKP